MTVACRRAASVAVAALALLCNAAWASGEPRAPPAPGWGVDACLSVHVSDAEFPAYLKFLRESGVRVVRERGFPSDTTSPAPLGVLGRFRALKAQGLRIVAFATLPASVPVTNPADALPEDLTQVFAQARRLGARSVGLVDAFEMVGEADIGFCRDLPDRVAAYQKALYLGLKAGARDADPASGEGPWVVMGALALPPGPWLLRAQRNGLLEYTDAYNLHYYGRAEDFAGVLRAHGAAAGANLPLWVTECGMKTVLPGAPFDPARRRLQSEFILATARTADREGAALFMPFILADHDDPYALTAPGPRPLMPWLEYAAWTRTTEWPARPWVRHTRPPNPVVLQWLPDPGAAVARKVSGTYRWVPGRPMHGTLWVYNFGARPARGRLTGTSEASVRSTFPLGELLSIPAGGRVALCGAFIPEQTGYFEAGWQGAFTATDGTRSPLAFGLETGAAPDDFLTSPLALDPLPADHAESARLHWPFPDPEVSSARGAWIGTNGVVVEGASGASARFRMGRLTGDPAGDPLAPPMAAARLQGLPPEGFLVVAPHPALSRPLAVRIDLIDDAGQRFTVWENFGRDYFSPDPTLWLKLSDFHPYFWGRCTVHPAFDPGRAREIQLRFYPEKPNVSMDLGFSVAVARVHGELGDRPPPPAPLPARARSR
jgi:hypothetical protein